MLRTIPDYPGALFIKVILEALNTIQLAVVVGRAPSWYGERWGKILCEQLSQSGFTITSGLACGIDGVAHSAALSVKGRSVAVLGNGLFSIYPRRHQALAMRLIESDGAIVSEFPLSAQPRLQTFRVAIGLSAGSAKACWWLKRRAEAVRWSRRDARSNRGEKSSPCLVR